MGCCICLRTAWPVGPGPTVRVVAVGAAVAAVPRIAIRMAHRAAAVVVAVVAAVPASREPAVVAHSVSLRSIRSLRCGNRWSRVVAVGLVVVEGLVAAVAAAARRGRGARTAVAGNKMMAAWAPMAAWAAVAGVAAMAVAVVEGQAQPWFVWAPRRQRFLKPC